MPKCDTCFWPRSPPLREPNTNQWSILLKLWVTEASCLYLKYPFIYDSKNCNDADKICYPITAHTSRMYIYLPIAHILPEIDLIKKSVLKASFHFHLFVITWYITIQMSSVAQIAFHPQVLVKPRFGIVQVTKLDFWHLPLYNRPESPMKVWSHCKAVHLVQKLVNCWNIDFAFVS